MFIVSKLKAFLWSYQLHAHGWLVIYVRGGKSGKEKEIEIQDKAKQYYDNKTMKNKDYGMTIKMEIKLVFDGRRILKQNDYRKVTS